MIDWEALFRSAKSVREHAYTPYSTFAVGAALLDEQGRIFVGCNVENASFGLTNCAERSAVFAMIAGGGKRVKALVVVAGAPRAISPCGACRQVLAEFSEATTPVQLFNLKEDHIETTVGDLLPYAFMKTDMQ